MSPEIVAAIGKVQASNLRISAARFNKDEIEKMRQAADEEYDMALKEARAVENALLDLVRGSTGV